MKPARFQYFAPAGVDECVALLAEHGEDAKVLAGGQSLVPMMNLRLAQPAVLVDVNRVAGLAYQRPADGATAIGAVSRHRDIVASGELAARQPLLPFAASRIGHPAIRARGTIGGSLAHADPVSELPCIAVTLDADLVAAGPGGRRTIAARDFFLGYFTTALAPDELLVEVRVPHLDASAGWAFEEFARRSGDFAVAAVAIVVRVADGVIADVRIGLAGVADRPLRAVEAEAELRGRPAGAAARAVRAAVAETVSGHAVRDDGGYRAHVAGALAERALAGALDRAEVR